MDYVKQREWSDQFLPQIKKILAPYTIETADFDTDTYCATDLIANPKHIAVRMRRYEHYLKHGNCFVMRSRTKTGNKTELQKIIDGLADWMFYGFATEDEKDIVDWFLIDLRSWRSHMIRNKKNIKYGEIKNDDGSAFVWFDILSFEGEPKLLISRKILDKN